MHASRWIIFNNPFSCCHIHIWLHLLLVIFFSKHLFFEYILFIPRVWADSSVAQNLFSAVVWEEQFNLPLVVKGGSSGQYSGVSHGCTCTQHTEGDVSTFFSGLNFSYLDLIYINTCKAKNPTSFLVIAHSWYFCLILDLVAVYHIFDNYTDSLELK